MKKFLKSIFAVVLVLTLALVLVACGPKDDGQGEGGNEGGGENPPAGVKRDVAASESGLTNMLGSGNLYVTTFGQADKDYIQEIVDEAIKGTQITYTFNNQLMASDVQEGDMVVAVVGYTSKGIAAEITQTGEIARAKAFGEKEGITLIICQLSDKTRRGESSDPIIAECAPKAEVVLILDKNNGKGADYDGKYSTVWCKDNPNLFLFSDDWNIYEYIAILVGASK